MAGVRREERSPVAAVSFLVTDRLVLLFHGGDFDIAWILGVIGFVPLFAIG